ncbi:hypothetical protein LKMONMHP_0779 [Methylobacterium organophilum]|uniref:Flagellar hook-length control protein-like C-terminal domain-containing protein n=1 Tax=Methylobacterium organophilum TaxID=410 RepID=A0ABQ4T2S6_METOR|nr:hypothetical protein LKMONMHP_0779 [Methylobacterium organophilum]
MAHAGYTVRAGSTGSTAHSGTVRSSHETVTRKTTRTDTFALPPDSDERSSPDRAAQSAGSATGTSVRASGKAALPARHDALTQKQRTEADLKTRANEKLGSAGASAGTEEAQDASGDRSTNRSSALGSDAPSSTGTARAESSPRPAKAVPERGGAKARTDAKAVKGDTEAPAAADPSLSSALEPPAEAAATEAAASVEETKQGGESASGDAVAVPPVSPEATVATSPVPVLPVAVAAAALAPGAAASAKTEAASEGEAAGAASRTSSSIAGSEAAPSHRGSAEAAVSLDGTGSFAVALAEAGTPAAPAPEAGTLQGAPPSGSPTPDKTAAAAAAPPQAPAPTAQVIQAPIAAVPMTIGLRSLKGSSQFEIRLDPLDLGRIDVTLDIDGDGGAVSAKLVVDRPETLALLRRDADSLQQALTQAGFDPGSTALDLSLRDPSGRGAGEGGNNGNGSASRPSRGSIASNEPESAPVEKAMLRSLRGLSGIDIRI